MKNIYFFGIAFLIFIAGLFLRTYKLDSVSASLNWDEVAAGYNAYTIANWGMDEWGNKFPVVFTSFRDDKHPVHIYITSVFVKAFGLNDFVTRLPSALVGSLSIILVILLGEMFFKSRIAGLFSGLLMAVSPYALQFSRGLWESNFALFFYLLALTMFYNSIQENYGCEPVDELNADMSSSQKVGDPARKTAGGCHLGLSRKKWLIPLSLVSFGISFFSYHSAKILVPPTIGLLFILEFKKLISDKKIFVSSLAVILFFIVFIIFNPRILGFARAAQTSFSKDLIQSTSIYKKTGNELYAKGEIIITNYFKYFDYKYLYINGDQGSRNSVKVVGEFYKIEAILLFFGIFGLIKYRSRRVLIILSWLFLAPIAGAVSGMDANANRAIFMLGSMQLIEGAGAVFLLNIAKNKWFQIFITLIILTILSFEFANYIKYYYQFYVTKDAIDWQYGMKDSALYAQKHKEFNTVYVDKIRQQPYIFFLYYLKVPLPELLKTVKYDTTESYTYNTVSSFGKYNFGNWNPIESIPAPDVLYIMTPSYYSGLRYISSFNVRKLVKYPNGSDAFYLVTGNEN